MFRFTDDKFNKHYQESPINNEIDKVASKFNDLLSLQVSLDKIKNEFQKKTLTVWNDQMRVGLLYLLTSSNGEVYILLKPRLEFIRTYCPKDLILSIRDMLLEQQPVKFTSITFVLAKNTNGEGVSNFLPQINGISWLVL